MITIVVCTDVAEQYKDILLRQFILFAEFLYIPRITVDISGEVDHVDSPHISTF